MQILRSASKVVFLLIAVTVCGGFLAGTLSEKEFVILAMMAFTFYFTKSFPSEKGDE